MKKRISAIITLSLILFITPQVGADEFIIGYIPNDSLPMGCGMQFWDKALVDPNGRILIDKDLKSNWLKIVINKNLQTFPNSKKISKIQREHEYTVGDSFVEEYDSNGFNIILNYRVIKVCPKDNPDCASTDYEGEMTIRSKVRKKIHFYLMGNGGC